VERDKRTEKIEKYYQLGMRVRNEQISKVMWKGAYKSGSTATARL
jgi:phosphate-selective porin